MNALNEIALAEITEWLNSHPDIQSVYINETGGWCYEERSGYPATVTRDDILNASTTSKSKKTNTKNNTDQ